MDTVFLGIDLGTFHTAVACSNGRREVIETAVGWPKDHIAREVLGREIVFGAEIHENRPALDVLRPFEKATLKYCANEGGSSIDHDTHSRADAARQVLAHAVDKVVSRGSATLCGVVGVPSRANREAKQAMLKIAQDVLDAVILVPEPFAAGYGTNRSQGALVIDIGAGTIDIYTMFGTLPSDEDQVTVSFGGDYIDEEFCQRMLTVYPEARLSLNMARKIKEKHGFVGGEERSVNIKLPVKGRPPQQFDVTEPLRNSCEMLVAKIVKGVHQLSWNLDPEIHERVIGNILLSGGGSQLRGLDHALEKALAEFGRVSVTRVYDSTFAGAMGALRLAMDTPAEHWDKLRPAVTSESLL